jgi:L-alanine-DL-glutamate epimerase-like enolase superfamily enzyme
MGNTNPTRKKPVWSEIVLEVLKDACQVCDCWEFGDNSIMEYLRDQGIRTTYGSAAKMAWQMGYKCLKLKRGGDHYKDWRKRRGL